MQRSTLYFLSALTVIDFEMDGKKVIHTFLLIFSSTLCTPPVSLPMHRSCPPSHSTSFYRVLQFTSPCSQYLPSRFPHPLGGTRQGKPVFEARIRCRLLGEFVTKDDPSSPVSCHFRLILSHFSWTWTLDGDSGHPFYSQVKGNCTKLDMTIQLNG